MKKIILLLNFGFLGMMVHAQTFSLDDCMRYAVEHNTVVKTQTYRNNIYRQDKTDAMADLLPSVSGYGDYSSNYGRTPDPSNNSYTNTSNISSSYALSTSMPIFQGFSGINKVRAQKMMQLMGVERLQQYKDETALQTMQAFFDVVYYTKSVSIAKEQLATSQQNLVKTRKLCDLGLKSEADVAQIAAQLASDDLLVTQEENKYGLAFLTLKDAMNYPMEDSLAIDAAAFLGETVIRLLDVSDNAVENHPKMLAANYELRSNQLNYTAMKGTLLPSLSISGKYATEYYKLQGSEVASFSSQFKGNRKYSYGATLSIPIFGGLDRYSNVRRSKNQMRISEQNRDEVKQKLMSEIRQTSMQMNGYAKEYVQASCKVEAAELSHRASQQKYEQGLVDAVELQTTANQLLTAKSQQLNANLQYMIKHKMVEYYNGQPLIK